MLRRTRSALVRKNRGRGWRSRSIGIRFSRRSRTVALGRFHATSESYLRYALGRGGGSVSTLHGLLPLFFDRPPPTRRRACSTFSSRTHPFLLFTRIYIYICIYIFFPSTIERENRDEVLWLGAWVFLEIRRMVGTEIREKRGRIDERGGGRGQRPGRQKGET